MIRLLLVCSVHSVAASLQRAISHACGSLPAQVVAVPGVLAAEAALLEERFHMVLVHVPRSQAPNTVDPLDFLRWFRQVDATLPFQDDIRTTPRVVIKSGPCSPKDLEAITLVCHAEDILAEDVLELSERCSADLVGIRVQRMASRRPWSRAAGRSEAPATSRQPGQEIRHGLLFLDLYAHKALFGLSTSVELDLTPTEMAYLRVLLRPPLGRCFTRGDLIAEVNEGNVELRTVDVHLKTLRAKLTAAAAQLGVDERSAELIRTVRGQGYSIREKPFVPADGVACA